MLTDNNTTNTGYLKLLQTLRNLGCEINDNSSITIIPEVFLDNLWEEYWKKDASLCNMHNI